MKTERVHLQAGTKPMLCYVARPEGAGPHPAVIVLQEAFGLTHHIRDVTETFARNGYVAIAPELFHRTAAEGEEFAYGNMEPVMKHMSAVNVQTIDEDTRACFECLSKDKAVKADKIGAIGFCMGGRAAFIANAKLNIKAAASFYGGRIAPDLLPLVAEQHAPIILAWGGKDSHIPVEQTRQVADALAKADKTHIDVRFSNADHGFLCTDRPAYHPVAAKQAWALVYEFFADNLKS